MDSITNIGSFQSRPYTVEASQPQTRTVGSEYSRLVDKQKEGPLSVAEQAVLNAINKVNKTLDGVPQKFEYKLHESSGTMVIRVFNKETNELIREIPPEKFIDLIDKLKETSIGSIFDEKR